MTWAGDSPRRRFVAWLGQTALLLAMAVAVYAVVMNVLVPAMTNGMTDVMRNAVR